MGGLLTPANIVVAVMVVVVLIVGGRRAMRGLTRGQSCCTDGSSATSVKQVEVTDADEAHYPYRNELLIGGMSCEGCAHNVENALNALPGVWARVDLAERTALVLSKEPLDESTCDEAVRAAGYYVRHA